MKLKRFSWPRLCRLEKKSQFVFFSCKRFLGRYMRLQFSTHPWGLTGQNWSPTVTQCFWNFYRITVVPHQLYKQATEHVCYPRPSAACPFPIVSSWGDPATTCPRGHTGTPLLPPKAQHGHDCPTMSPCDLKLAAKPRGPPHQGLGPPTTPAPFERTRQPSTHPTEFYRFGSQNRWLGWQAPHDMTHFSSGKIQRKVTGTLKGGCWIQPLHYNPPVVLNFGVKEMSCHKARGLTNPSGRWWEKSHGFPSPETKQIAPWKRGDLAPKSKGSVSKPLIFRGLC